MSSSSRKPRPSSAPSSRLYVAPSARWYDDVSSTNDVAREAFLKEGIAGVFHCASQQTAGRGRYGRPWISPEDKGFYGSIALNDSMLKKHVGLLQFALAIAAAQSIKAIEQDVHIQVKWPNDLLVGEAKIGGILVEVETQGTHIEYAVAGLGINLLHDRDDLPSDLDYPATSLFLESGNEHSPSEFPVVLCRYLNEILGYIAREDLDTFWSAFQEHWHDKGRHVEVTYRNGMTFQGTVDGLNESGAIIIDTENGKERLLSGTLRFLDAVR